MTADERPLLRELRDALFPSGVHLIPSGLLTNGERVAADTHRLVRAKIDELIARAPTPADPPFKWRLREDAEVLWQMIACAPPGLMPKTLSEPLEKMARGLRDDLRSFAASDAPTPAVTVPDDVQSPTHSDEIEAISTYRDLLDCEGLISGDVFVDANSPDDQLHCHETGKPVDDWCSSCAMGEAIKQRDEARAEAKQANIRAFDAENELEEVGNAFERWRPMTDSLDTTANALVDELHKCSAESDEARRLLNNIVAADDEPLGGSGMRGAVDAARKWLGESK